MSIVLGGWDELGNIWVAISGNELSCCPELPWKKINIE